MEDRTGLGPYPFYALEVMSRVRKIEIPNDGHEMVRQGLIHSWQVGENGEVSPFATLAVEEAINRPVGYCDDERR